MRRQRVQQQGDSATGRSAGRREDVEKPVEPTEQRSGVQPAQRGAGGQYRRGGLERGQKRLPGGRIVDAAEAQPDDGQSGRERLQQRLRGRRSLKVDRHSSTTAHCCSLYPFGVHSSSGYEGVYLGRDKLAFGEAFFYDPFVAYKTFAGEGATNTNMLVLGVPGVGKSALVKTLLYRSSAVYGTERYLSIVDVKGEYTTLAEELGLSVVKLTPGGSVRVNPLERRAATSNESHSRLMRALLSAVMHRPLTPVEEVLLWEGVIDCAEGRAQATVQDLRRSLSEPSRAALAAARLEESEASDASNELVYATDKLLDRDLRGMFDGHSTVSVDIAAPGVVLDISDAQHDEEVLPLVMTAGVAWLQELVLAISGKKKILLNDESWRMVAYEGTARFMQSSWKLGRSYGAANIAVLHKASDLAAQADDGTATSKIATGLVADTAVRVSFKQTSHDLESHGDVLGFTEMERAEISGLGRGESLWKIGNHVVVLEHDLAASGPERSICDTDQALAA